MKMNAMTRQFRQAAPAMLMATAFVFCLALPEMALAQGQNTTAAKTSIKSFFNSVVEILNFASIAVVTIAVIFAGYQIAFNNKRLSEVAMVLIGGFLIGTAAQIAKLLLPKKVVDQVLLMPEKVVDQVAAVDIASVVDGVMMINSMPVYA